jgi:hypothetical protein
MVLPVRVLTTISDVRRWNEAQWQRWELTDLHTATKTENEMESGLLLNVIIRQSATVLELLAGKDQALLVRRDTLLVLNLALDIVDGIRGLNLEGDGLAGDCDDVNPCWRWGGVISRRQTMRATYGS